MKIDYFKNIDTKEKAYWLGFLFADGYIDKKSKRLSLNQSIKDEFQVDKFLTVLELPLTKKKYYGPYKNTGKFVQITIDGKEFVSHLITNGCTNKKTFTIKYPLLKTFELDLAFLLGYYDGDGTTNKCDITCGSLDFLLEIKNKFDIKNSPKQRKNKFGSCYVLNIGNNLMRKVLNNFSDSLVRKRYRTRRINGVDRLLTDIEMTEWLNFQGPGRFGFQDGKNYK